MDVLQNPIIKAAIAGALGALLVDLRAWAQAPDDQPFNVKKAVIRWVYGAVAGAAAAAGIGAIA